MSVVIEMVSALYKKYGLSTLFEEMDYTIMERKKNTVIYRARSLFSTNLHFYGYKIDYDIQYCVFDISTISLVNNIVRKCLFCQKNGCHYKLNCCKKFAHLDCILHNSECCFNLKKKKIKEECMVCFEECDTDTQCGHPICLTCIGNIKKEDNSIECPMCRKNLRSSRKYFDMYSIEIPRNNDQINIRLTELTK